MVCTKELVTQHFGGTISGHGPLRSDETVLIGIFATTRMNGSKLAPTAFPTKDLKRGEISLARWSFTNLETFEEFVIQPKSRAGDEFRGVARANAGKIRQIEHQIAGAVPPTSARFFCLIDKVTERDFDGHAAVEFSESWSELTEKQKSRLSGIATADLANVFGSLEALEALYP